MKNLPGMQDDFGITVIRLDDPDVKRNMDEVLSSLKWQMRELANKNS